MKTIETSFKKKHSMSGLSLNALALILIFLINFFAAGSSWAIPSTLNYQGNISVEGNAFTGTGYFKFAIVSENGRTIWSHDSTSVDGSEPESDLTIEIEAGLYSITLGNDEMDALDPQLFNTDNILYLRIWFDDGESGFSRFDPDIRLTSTIYSFAAQSLQGYLPEDFVLADDEIPSENIADRAITNSKIADGAVTASKITSFSNSGNTFTLGNSTETNVTLQASLGRLAAPAIRYNSSSSQWEISNNGSSYSAISTASLSNFSATIIDDTNVEAFLVRKDADAGDIFNVDTTNGRVATSMTGTAISAPVVSGTAMSAGLSTVKSDSASSMSMASASFSDTASRSVLQYSLRSRGTQAVQSVVQDDDIVMDWISAGYDGSDFEPLASIRTEIDNTPGLNDMPGRLVFSTTSDGSASLTERLRIDSSGNSTFTEKVTADSYNLTYESTPSDQNWYANPTTGNDANDCSSSTPCATIQRILSLIASSSYRGRQVINLADGTYSGNLSFPSLVNSYGGVPFSGSLNFRNNIIYLKGNATNRANVVFESPNNSVTSAMFIPTGMTVALEGMKIQSLKSGSRAFTTDGILYIKDVDVSDVGTILVINTNGSVFVENGTAPLTWSKNTAAGVSISFSSSYASLRVATSLTINHKNSSTAINITDGIFSVGGTNTTLTINGQAGTSSRAIFVAGVGRFNYVPGGAQGLIIKDFDGAPSAPFSSSAIQIAERGTAFFTGNSSLTFDNCTRPLALYEQASYTETTGSKTYLNGTPDEVYIQPGASLISDDGFDGADIVSFAGRAPGSLYGDDYRYHRTGSSAVASANDLTLGSTVGTFIISNNTQINAINTTGWQAGSEIILIFTGTPTVKHNTAGGAGTAKIKLDGEADLVAGSGSVLKLVYDGTDWREVSRSSTGL